MTLPRIMMSSVDKNHRYENSGKLIGSEYFLHAHGPIYALSADTVVFLANARNDRLVISSYPFVNFDGEWRTNIPK